MKKFLICTLMLMSIFVTATLFSACGTTEPLVIKESDTYIVITVSSEQMELTEETTLVEYMTSLKESGELEFEIKSGMVSSVNGISNPADYSSCWMLYTDDEDNSNVAWGTIEYNEKIYGSAILGAETLKVKDSCVYIWVYQTF